MHEVTAYIYVTAPAELAAVTRGRAGTGYMPMPAGPATGDAARCGAVPQPAKPAAETGGPGPAAAGQAGGGKRCEVRRGAAIGSGGERCDGGETRREGEAVGFFL